MIDRVSKLLPAALELNTAVGLVVSLIQKLKAQPDMAALKLGEALDATATRQVACDLALPEPPVGQRLDYDTVNVVLEGEKRATLPRVGGASACGREGGWYYDVEPSSGAPSRLNVCKSSCARTQAVELSIELGCRTVVR